MPRSKPKRFAAGRFLFDYQRKLRSRNSAGGFPLRCSDLLSSRLSPAGVASYYLLAGASKPTRRIIAISAPSPRRGPACKNAGVTAVAISIRGCYLIEQLLNNVFFGYIGKSSTAACQCVLLAECNHFLGHAAYFFCSVKSGLNRAVFKKVRYQSAKHRITMRGSSSGAFLYRAL